MTESVETKVVARIHNGYKEKFGIPRQSGITKDVLSEIVFEKEYRDDNALRGIEEFSHLWLIWSFSEFSSEGWSPTVRPPRLGGNKRMGVFATRSPNRPNKIGLSSVELVEVKKTKDRGTILVVKGADLLDGTPIFDIKPYLAFTDSHSDASGGFADGVKDYSLDVVFKEELLSFLPEEKRLTVESILSQDPRPSYQDDPNRVYGMSCEDYEIKFTVKDGVLTVVDIQRSKE